MMNATRDTETTMAETMPRDELLEIEQDALAAAEELREAGFHAAAAEQDALARQARRALDEEKR